MYNGRAGFSSAIRRIEAIDVGDALALIKPLLSQPGGQAVRLGESDLVLLSDLQPRLLAILDVLDRLDHYDPSAHSQVERIVLQFADATQLVAQVNAAVLVRDSMQPRPLSGKLAASIDGMSVILIAPPAALDAWHTLIEQFDQREPVVTKTYAPHQFALDEVASLIERSVRSERRGAGDAWRLVQDTLTGSLIITATPAEHDAIDNLLARLAAVPPAERQGMRAFVLRNRSVTDIVEIIEQLVESDSLLGLSAPATPEADLQPTNASDTNQGSIEGASSHPTVSARGTMLNTSSLSITADEDTSTLIAIGEPRHLAELESLLKILDVRQPQVELEIFIVSMNDSDSLDFGIELQKLEVSGSTLIGLSSLFGLSDISLESESPFTGGRGFSGIVLSPGDFSVVVRALKTLNQGVSRSYPKILVNNNQPGTLDSVVQQPFAQINASDTVATTSFGEFVDAGTQITVTPQIAEGDHLVLEYSVSLSAFIGESSDPSLPPPRQETSVQSVVTIPDGYAIAVGGLDIISEADAETAIPLLSDIPILGEAFKSQSRSNSRSRFYVFIRANVLRHNEFEDLKYLSDRKLFEAGVDDGWPDLEPRIIR